MSTVPPCAAPGVTPASADDDPAPVGEAEGRTVMFDVEVVDEGLAALVQATRSTVAADNGTSHANLATFPPVAPPSPSSVVGPVSRARVCGPLGRRLQVLIDSTSTRQACDDLISARPRARTAATCTPSAAQSDIAVEQSRGRPTTSSKAASLSTVRPLPFRSGSAWPLSSPVSPGPKCAPARSPSRRSASPGVAPTRQAKRSATQVGSAQIADPLDTVRPHDRRLRQFRADGGGCSGPLRDCYN